MSESLTNKLPGAAVQTSYVHFSKNGLTITSHWHEPSYYFPPTKVAAEVMMLGSVARTLRKGGISTVCNRLKCGTGNQFTTFRTVESYIA